MQRYLELRVREGEEENNQVPIKGKNQLTITRFAVTTPRHSQVPRARSPIQSSPVKQMVKRPVGHPPKAKKARIEIELKHVVREEYERWVSMEKYDEACFLENLLWHESY